MSDTEIRHSTRAAAPVSAGDRLEVAVPMLGVVDAERVCDRAASSAGRPSADEAARDNGNGGNGDGRYDSR
ncbi:MAG: hypothetical protein ACPMAQ_04955, partial [Phycisphaerae bacterium]